MQYSKILLLSALLLLPLWAASQDFRLGINAGVTHYQGDLSPGGKDLSNVGIGRTNVALGFFGRFNHHPFFNTRIGFQYGKVEAYDADSEIQSHVSRNLSFESNIFELSLVEEFNILGFEPGTRKIFSPYLFAGIGVFRFNPKTIYQGQEIELQPLGTEGQGIATYPEAYSLTQIAVPLGGGLKFAVADNLTLALEIGGRKLFTDYLDDVSNDRYASFQELLDNNGELAALLGNRQGELLGGEPIQNPIGPRGNPEFKDWYFFSTISLAFSLNGNGGGLFGGNQMGCPTF